MVVKVARLTNDVAGPYNDINMVTWESIVSNDVALRGKRKKWLCHVYGKEAHVAPSYDVGGVHMARQ